jgi:flagellar biosynthesis protein FlhG
MSDSTINFQRHVSRAGGLAHDNAGPHTLVVSGGKAEVGATTLAIRLAQAQAQDAHRVVLIDGDLQKAAIAAQCNLNAALGIGDVLAGRKTIHEVLQRGPAGMHVLTGTSSAELRETLTERSIQRLVRHMRSLGPHADWLVVDAGHEPSEFTRRLWTAADRLLLVTSPDPAAVMDTYALIKTLLSRQALRKHVSLVINHAPDEANAADVHRRIDQSCRRFLGLSIEYAGCLPTSPVAEIAVSTPDTTQPLATALARIARHVFPSSEFTGSRRLAA